MSKPIFIIGNKRSGSTHLMKLLNLHPNIFVSNESDIVWILYQFHQGKAIETYPWDDPLGMETTLENHQDLLDSDKTPFENFVAMQTAIMKNGTVQKGLKRMQPMHKEDLKWIGDQKPFQQTDPEILPFIREHFPDAHFIHLIRHPFPVVRSSQVFLGDGGYIWKGMTPEQLLERWTMHEKWVVEAKQQGDLPILDMPYEKIVNNTQLAMREMLDFLGLDYDQELLKKARCMTERALKLHPAISCPQDTLEIMQQFSYKDRNALLENQFFVKNLNRLLKIKYKLTGCW